MRRTILLAGHLLCLFSLGGCIFPYCAYPTLDWTPRVKLDTSPSEVHAFRVDIIKATADLGVFVEPGDESLSAIPVASTDEVPAQVKASVSYGFVVIGFALNFLTHTSHSVALRVYRPGYELVEIRSWERVNRVAWKPAGDLGAQEKAIDRLLPLDRLEAGSRSPAHREAILFGAAEYERLASVAQSQDDQARLATKAGKMRTRAEK